MNQLSFKVLLFLKIVDYLKQKINETCRYKATKAAIDYLNSIDCTLPAEERVVIKKYLSEYLITQIPYPFVNKYLLRKSILFFDKNILLPYVLHNGKKLYFKKSMSKAEIISGNRFRCDRCRALHNANALTIIGAHLPLRQFRNLLCPLLAL